MKLIDLFTDVTYGELSNLFLGGFVAGEPESEPDPTRYAQLIAATNMGLTQLYKEFFLRSEEHYIALSAEKSTYKIHSDYAQTNTASPILIADRYIMDTLDAPFSDNLLKIEEVYDEEGVKIPLNDVTEDLSVFTPAFNTIQVPYPEDGMTISVQFRATHPRIVYTGIAFDPATVEIELPNSLKEALQFYIASRIMRPLGGERSVEADNFYQLFKDSVRVAKDEGLEVQGEPGDWRFDQNGWV